MFSIENTASTSSVIPTDAPIYRYSMCNGTENNFRGCQLPRSDSGSTCPSIGAVNCTEGMYVSYIIMMGTPFYFLSCSVASRCFTEGRFQLTNRTSDFFTAGSITIEGRIEVCLNSTYHSPCDYYWNPVDAQVFCRRYMTIVYGAPPSANISKEMHTYIIEIAMMLQCKLRGHTLHTIELP